MDARGGHRRLLTYPDSSSGARDYGPSWSPDRTKIVFSRSSFTSDGHLFVVPEAGGRARPLHLAGSEPAWGPRGIAYVGDNPNVIDDLNAIWTVNSDGSNPRLVATGRRLGSPAWSRDGRLAYLGGDYRTVHVIGRTRTSFRLPLREPTLAPELAWSPDGARLLFTAGAGTSPAELYSVTLKRHRVRRLTTAMGNVVGMSWR
jgi:WD40-like Beta Propeller Repeat